MNQPTITLLPRRKGDLHPVFDRHFQISAELGWLLKGPPEALDAAANALAGVCERISDNDVLLLAFGNAVGFFDVPGLGRIEVMSGKWSRADFDKMLAELTDIASGLPFSATSTAALPYDRAVAAQEDILYHMFVYIRHALSDASTGEEQLLPALRHVLRDPYRRFERKRRNVAIDQVSHLNSAALTAIVAGKGGFTRIPPNHAAYGVLAQSLRGHLPEWVGERHTVSTVDTPENRFIKSFLASMSGVIDRMRDISSGLGSSAFAIRTAQECDRLDAVLKPIVQAPVWREVGPMVHLPASSPVLQRRRGYRDVYRHFAKMRLAARVPLDQDLVRDLLEAKDIALLYEVWSYFVVAREISCILGEPLRADAPRADYLQITVPWDLECVWSDGTRLLYNPQFSRSRKHHHSFSVPLRPDIALHVPSGPNAGLHLLDAKFKVDHLGDVMPSEEENEESAEVESEERHGTFKRGDLYKMHAYRDAIAAARSVWIIYPGTETRFFSEKEGVVKTCLSLPYSLDGVGAVPVRPGDGRHFALQAVLDRLLDSEFPFSDTVKGPVLNVPAGW